MTDCTFYVVAVAFLSLALFISICVNIIFLIKQRGISRGIRDYRLQHSAEEAVPSQNQRHYLCNPDNEDQQENLNHHQEQDNPIYGNIGAESTVDCYETMTAKHPRKYAKMSEPDLNYASLDLKAAKKRRHKHRRQYGHDNQSDQPDQLAQAENARSPADEDAEPRLPPRDSSIMVSHSSIYLNSQQIAQEAEELERERSWNVERENAEWQGVEDAKHEWEMHEEDEKQMDELCGCDVDGDEPVETTQNGSDSFTETFDDDNN